MAFQFRQPANTQVQTQSGGTTSTVENIDSISKWADSLESTATPHLTKAKKSETFNNPVHQWGQSIRKRKDTNLSAGINNSVTVIPVTTGTGLIFQAQAMIEITDPRAGTTDVPDVATREVLFVQSISTDSLTVAARGTWGPAFAHASGAMVRIVGTAEPENGQHAEASRIRGFKFFNYPMRFNAKLTADKRYQNTPTWEHKSNPHLADFEEEMIVQKELLERWMFMGVRYRGDYTVGSPLPSTFGGINSFLTSNVVNMGGQLLGPDALESAMREIWYDLDDIPGREWIMGMDESMFLDAAINPLRRGTLQDSSMNKVVQTYKTRVGEISVTPSRNVPRGEIYLIDWNSVNVLPYQGLDWHHTQLKGEENAVDNDVDAISGDFTLEVLRENTMARIYNFDMTAANYPSASYY